MGYMIYGAAGALLVLALVLLGFGLGWKACRVWRARDWEAARLCEELIQIQKNLAEPEDRETDERARREAEERQRAFESMLNYDAATAYGTDAPLEELIREADK